MTRNVFLSLIFHSVMIVATALSLPFMKRSPIDLPPILSVELIQITDKTSVPYAAKAAKTLEKIKKKEEEKRVVSEQAPPAEKKKEKPDRIPIPEDLNKEKKQIVKKKQNPEEIKEQIRQASEFEKKELFDPNQIAALIDKSKEETAETLKKNKKLKRLVDHHTYLNKKVGELTKDRRKDRSDESKQILMRLKKTKLAMKDAIASAKAKLGLTKK